MQKYNPTYHINVVNNYRRRYREEYQRELSLTNAQIWDIQTMWEMCEGYERITLEELHEANLNNSK